MRVLVSEFMSLDGVVQAPGGKEEDTSGGFRHGGWSFEYFDPQVMGAVVDEYAERSGDPFSDWINGAQKYVVSDTLSESDLTWLPTTIIRPAQLVEQVSALRDQPGGEFELISAETAKTGVQVCRYRPRS